MFRRTKLSLDHFSQIFEPRFYWSKKNSKPIFLTQIFFSNTKFFQCPKIFQGPKFFSNSNFIDPEKFSNPNVWTKNFFSAQNIFRGQHFFRIQILLITKKLRDYGLRTKPFQAEHFRLSLVIVTVCYFWFCKDRLVKLVRLDKLAWPNQEGLIRSR